MGEENIHNGYYEEDEDHVFPHMYMSNDKMDAFGSMDSLRNLNFNNGPDDSYNNDSDDGNMFSSSLDFLTDYQHDFDYNEDSDFGQQSTEFPEYTEKELHETEVTFLRPGFAQDSNDFETKTIYWCLTNGFEEVEANTWSGPWYWKYFGGSMEDAKKKRLERRGRKLNALKKFMDTCKISEDTMSNLSKLKQLGNDDFQQKNYEGAIRQYNEAITLVETIVYKKILPEEQKKEIVNIYSNMAECHLRCNNLHDCVSAATNALQINKNHVKSLYRRAKANLQNSETDNDNDATTLLKLNPSAYAQAEEDVEAILRQKDITKHDREKAQHLKKIIETKIQIEIDKIKKRGGFN